ncbi:VC_2705 family sodium/solute symporter [Paucibacter sp. APW11]|uniref:VC_2705 family sodium/solute symporter n=1 Tax=Roseateles aquae TaxID=3077235 RepID=A0ABU3P862_9BURK|nr:VC_2705 family sodium/solute symporter [Paucibacter sp. APW11]MDT8998482.1 VC_2705 family sodium/solute symporter [Paucibacter sp. APW11]
MPPPTAHTEPGASQGLGSRLNRIYLWYTLGFAAFVLVLALLERIGLPKSWIGFSFLAATVIVYAGIGIIGRTTDIDEYYVAGRRVPAFYNGLAAGADWMSAASFIGMAGTLYLSGYGGLAFVMGWTGGFCLVAILIAPFMRRFAQFTVPDFLGARYGGEAVRLIGASAAVLISFVYVVAQIYGIGLITARLTGLSFELGVFVGLGGVLVCSFLGGMRAVTWTQVAQYIILIAAYLVPVVWLSIKQTGVPVPQAVYGYQLQKLSERERELIQDPAELSVRRYYAEHAKLLSGKLEDVAGTLARERTEASRRVAALKQQGASLAEIQAAEKRRAALPKTEAEASEQWQRGRAADEQRAKPLAGMPPHALPFSGDPEGSAAERESFDLSRRNFLALVFCLMVGTAGLPHILTRYYTTPSVGEARRSVAWSLLFIGLLYFTAPALAVMVKYEVFNSLVGTPIAELPSWIGQWMKVDPGLLSINDVNGDGVLQLGELQMGGDIVMLLTPELAGLPYVVAGMVAAGGLAAALSTADGLLLTISSALSHDIYYKVLNPRASATRRVTLSKALLLATALSAAAFAAQKPADILFLVSAAFSLAGATFVPSLVLGVFWQRANRWGAIAGMLGGFALTLFYMVQAHDGLRLLFGVPGPATLWWGIQPISAAVFGLPFSVLLIVLVSLLTPAPAQAVRELLAELRSPPQPG